MPPAAPAPSGTPGPRPAYWFPLLLFGGLAALSLPLSVLESPRSATSYAMLTREIYPTVTQAMYFGGSSASAPFPFPLGWYWGRPIPAASLGLNAWSWLDSLWRLGTFALLAVGVGLAILARAGHSRALAAITVIYLGAVSLAGWAGLQQPVISPVFPFGDPGVLLPAAVLLLSGLGAVLAASLRELRGRRR